MTEALLEDLAERTQIPTAEFALPEKPILTIVPRSGWVRLNLAEIWQHRELLYFLTWRDIKIRYKQTALGAAWAIIQPLFPMIVFTLFFGKLAKIPSDGIPYSIFAYAGLLPWTYFSAAVTASSASVLGNANLITKIYFPRLMIPGAGVLAALLDFALAMSLLAGLMIWHHVPLAWSQLMLIPLILNLTLLSLSIGILFSALTVQYRDIRYALPFAIQLWMFATPVIYPASLLPEKWRWTLSLNPLTGIVEGFRSALFAREFHWSSLAISGIFSIVCLIYASFIFRRMERSFADLI